MKPAPFRHHAPTTIDEAVALLAELAPQDRRVLAGGQSLVPTMAFRPAAVDPMEDVHNSARYRRDLVRPMVRRALQQPAARDFK